MQRNTKLSGFLIASSIPLAMLGIIGAFLAPQIREHNASRQNKHKTLLTVRKAYTGSNGDFKVLDNHGLEHKNTNSSIDGKYNAEKLQEMFKPGQTYRIEEIGLRDKKSGAIPNILKAEPMTP